MCFVVLMHWRIAQLEYSCVACGKCWLCSLEALSIAVRVRKIVLDCRGKGGCTREEGVRLDISGCEGEGGSLRYDRT